MPCHESGITPDMKCEMCPGGVCSSAFGPRCFSAFEVWVITLPPGLRGGIRSARTLRRVNTEIPVGRSNKVKSAHGTLTRQPPDVVAFASNQG